jgi:hypothetical protein
MKRLLLAAVLISAPLGAWAQCSHSDQQAMSCIEGQIWDPATNACVPVVTG